MSRTIAVLTATALAALTLAGCTVETQTCKNGVCTIKLKGANATTKLGGEGGSDLTLISASGKSAKVKIDANTGVLTVGEPIKLTNATLLLEAVNGKDDVKIKLTGDTGSATK